MDFGNPAFTTVNGSPVVTVSAGKGGQALVNGDVLYFPVATTVNGVALAAGNYTISAVDTTGLTFTITGIGNASSSGTGGGAGVYGYIHRFAPYSPMQVSGEWSHGIVTNHFLSDSGYLIETQPGNGISWSDGSGTASLTTTLASAGNISLLMAAPGTGQIKLNTAGGGIVVGGSSDKLAFFGTALQAKPTGVAITAAGIHAALTTLGLISA
jgi:hypothetical protein